MRRPDSAGDLLHQKRRRPDQERPAGVSADRESDHRRSGLLDVQPVNSRRVEQRQFREEESEDHEELLHQQQERQREPARAEQQRTAERETGADKLIGR